MTKNEIRSYLDAVVFCKNYLTNKSICNQKLAINEAMSIVAQASYLHDKKNNTNNNQTSSPQKTDVIPKLKQNIDKQQLKDTLAILLKRAVGMPYAYINKKKSFYDLDFEVSEKVLIPRYDSEIIFDYLGQLELNKNIKILDLGCGSGVLGLTMLSQFLDAHLVATDISFDALNITKKNALRLNLMHRISLIQTNWHQPFLEKPLFDIVISNPPYIKSDQLNPIFIQKNAKKYQNLDFLSLNFEPKLALDGGKDGLDCYRTFAKNISSIIKPNCYLILEIGACQEKKIITLFDNLLELNYNKTILDLNNLPRFLVFRKKSFFRKNT